MAGKLNPKRGKAWDPARDAVPVVHDRRAKDLNIGTEGHVTTMVVVDPFGDSTEVVRVLRDDPLARMHSKKDIDEAQYAAGRAFQEDWQVRAEMGLRGIQVKEFTDGGLGPEAVTQRQQKAAKALHAAKAAIEQEHGKSGYRVTCNVLIDGWAISFIVQQRGVTGDRWRDYFGKQFRACLETLAVVYGKATKRP